MKGGKDGMEERGLACDLEAIDPADRADHVDLARRLLGPAALAREERPDGFRLRFAGSDYPAVARFVGNESRCCPFLRFVIEVAPGGGEVWLEVEGPAGAREIVQAALDGLPGSPGGPPT